MHVCVSGGKIYLSLGKFGGRCFLVTPVMRFALLPYSGGIISYRLSEAYLQPCRISTLKILSLLILQIRSNIDVQLDSKYASILTVSKLREFIETN